MEVDIGGYIKCFERIYIVVSYTVALLFSRILRGANHFCMPSLVSVSNHFDPFILSNPQYTNANHTTDLACA